MGYIGKLLSRTMVATALLGLAQGGHAADYPSKPLVIIVGNAAGGPTDTLTRLVAEPLRKSLGVPVIVESKPGAAMMLAFQAVSSAKPDGYTIAIAAAGIVTLKVTNKDYTLDPEKDFTYIVQMTNYPSVLAINANAPYKTMPEFFAYVRSHPGKLNFGYTGGPLEIDAGMFKYMSKLDYTAVPYPAGSAPMTAALAAGQIDAALANYSSIKPMVDAGKIKVIGVASSTRFTPQPDLKAIATEVPGYEASMVWYGMIGPARMPPDITSKLNEQIRAAMRSPGVVKWTGETNLDIVTGTPEEYRAVVMKDYDYFRNAARILDLQAR